LEHNGPAFFSLWTGQEGGEWKMRMPKGRSGYEKNLECWIQANWVIDINDREN